MINHVITPGEMYDEDIISPLLDRGLFKDVVLDKDGYSIAQHSWIKTPAGEPSIEYRLNRHGFRSDHFKFPDPNAINILVAGDSLTFGEGVPAEYIWGNLLANRIYGKTKRNVSVTNLGVMGGSGRLAVRNIFSYIRNYGKPDFIFLLIPSVTRNIIYNEDLGAFTNFYSHVNKVTSRNKIIKRHTKFAIKEDSMLLTTDYIRMLDDLCNELGIGLRWTSWEEMDYEQLSSLDFDSFVDYPHGYEPGENRLNLPYWHAALDGNHPGTAWNINMARTFFDTIYPCCLKK